MPESGPVVKALERISAHDNSCCEWSGELAKAALPLAREQEALLRAYFEYHQDARREWAEQRRHAIPEECRCDLCERVRKVLP